jgi:prolyl-tRNA editing enzyme YbaK/EbsC (Cys-tRNA(Pro) deacylase)
MRSAPSVERVRASLIALGVADPPIRTCEAGTAPAVDAAAAIGTTVERIVKSLVFMADQAPILVLASGPNRVDTARLGSLVGAAIKRADADQVRAATSFPIGGVPPVGHPAQLPTYVDRDLLQHETVWAAAGTPNAVFSIAPHTLVHITAGQVADIAAR